MKRIEGPGHIDNTFTDGSAILGVPPTIVTADWLNDKQEELCNVVEAAGLTLDKTDQTQLKQAISALAGAGSALWLHEWQTDPDQYTVLEQSMDDPDGKGEDLLYKFVFPASAWTAMYCEIMVPFTGFDLQLVFPYRMSTSNAGNVEWKLYYRIVTTGEAHTELTNWNAWAAVGGSSASYVDTPSATVNQRNLISGTDLVIPSAAITAQFCTLQLALVRVGSGDTHNGNAEVSNSILLVPALP